MNRDFFLVPVVLVALWAVPAVEGQTNYQPFYITTLAGTTGVSGSANGTGTVARFNAPFGVAADQTGNIYVSDSAGHTIRKITPGGVVSTLAGLSGSAGSVDGTNSTARFFMPYGLAVGGDGNIYVADFFNNSIRKITPAGIVTTLAGCLCTSTRGSTDGPGSTARFWSPYGVAIDGNTNVYVADTYNTTIRKITPSGDVSTLAGLAGSGGYVDGTNGTARFRFPTGVAVDGAGNVYVADQGNHCIRKVTSAGVVTTLAGSAGSYGSVDAVGISAKFYQPSALAVDKSSNVYVADTYNRTIRKITPAGVVVTLAGLPGAQGSADGTGGNARFNTLYGIAVDNGGNIYVPDVGAQTVRWGANAAPGLIITASNGAAIVTIFAPTGLQYRMEFGINLEGSNWTAFTNVILSGGSNLIMSMPILDPQAIGGPSRFYRAVLVP